MGWGYPDRNGQGMIKGWVCGPSLPNWLRVPKQWGNSIADTKMATDTKAAVYRKRRTITQTDMLGRRRIKGGRGRGGGGRRGDGQPSG